MGVSFITGCRRLSRRLGAAVAVLALSAGAAYALDDVWSLQFGPTGGGASDAASEREQLKAFERNPPAGFPTLSSANIAATKAAIAHYEKIVAAGGWKPVPTARVKPGEAA